MKDLNVFVDAGQGFLQFDHDRTLEYFLALAFASGAEPSLETMDDLLRFLQSFKTQSKPIAAARLYFQLNPREFSLISTSLRLLDSPDNRYQPSDRETLFGFARDVLVQMTEQREPRVQDYLNDVIDAARAGGMGSVQLRTVVQSAASLPVESAVPLLTKVGHPSFSQAQTEANIFATDKLVKQYLVSRCPAISLLHDKPYAVFFGDSSIAPWQRLGRLLRFSSQLGPDNTHPNEYNSVLQILDKALTEILSERPWSELEIKSFADYFIANSDRLLFNATTDGISEFFSNPRRHELESMLENIQACGLLTENDLDEIKPYTTSLSFDVEYHLSHALGILSSFNDLEHMLRLMEARFQTFSNDTSPNEIDFFYSLLVYLHVLHNLPYDEARFKWWEESVLRDWPGILQYRPGLERGERRGFHDAFDRVFEDGFSVVFPYGVLLPSLRRRRSVFADYRRELASESSSQLPMYTRYLEEFLRDERIEEALQILQALAGVIVAWPVEGLLSLRGVVGHSDPRIRRATVRILAEAFNRHPEETMQFLKTSGAAVSEEELIEIKIRQDARIGRRQVDEREWARIGHWLLRRPNGREAFANCIKTVLRATTFHEAVSGVLLVLGVVEPTGR